MLDIKLIEGHGSGLELQKNSKQTHESKGAMDGQIGRKIKRTTSEQTL